MSRDCPGFMAGCWGFIRHSFFPLSMLSIVFRRSLLVLIPLVLEERDEPLDDLTAAAHVALPVRDAATLELRVLATQPLKERLGQRRGGGRDVQRRVHGRGRRGGQGDGERDGPVAVGVGEGGRRHAGRRRRRCEVLQDVSHHVHRGGFEGLESVRGRGLWQDGRRMRLHDVDIGAGSGGPRRRGVVVRSGRRMPRLLR